MLFNDICDFGKLNMVVIVIFIFLLMDMYYVFNLKNFY